MHKTLGFAAGLFFLAAGSSHAADDVMIVFDGSNSMWGQIDGVAKIEIARDAMESLLGDWTENTNVGLMAYGHRRQGDCSDIETLVAPGPLDRDDLIARIHGITPRGKTPLTDAVEQAAEQLSYRDNPATVVLITDGIESCQRDPCALAEDLERMGVGFTAHVVAFDLQGEDQEAVACMAERTGGRFVAADDAEELGVALSEVGTAVAEAPEPEPEPEAEPEPAPEPSVIVSAPESAREGSVFSVSWSASEQQPRDFVTIVPMGAEEGEHGDYTRVGDDSEGTLQAPAETGLYEVRYVVNETRATGGSAEIEIVEAEVTVDAPLTATAGETIPVSWSDVIHRRDFVTIVPMGAEEGEHGDYTRVGDGREGNLQAPAEAGLYEVRYVLNEGRKTMASAEMEIVEAKASVEAPERATAGESFSVSWSDVIHRRDFVTIVPMGAEEGEHGDYTRVGDAREGTLQAPAETGLYEVRYVLNEGRGTLASAPIEIVEAEVSVEAPERATAGSSFSVSWSDVIHRRDFVTIVPTGAEEGEHGDYTRVGDGREGTLQAPSEPGLYEVRYVLNEGRSTLASAPIEIVTAEVSVRAPESVIVGSSFDVRWSNVIHSRDFVTIVPMGAEEGDHGDYTRVGGGTEGSLTAPSETGLYEVRYVLNEGRGTLASVDVEVIEADIELSGPETVRAGSDIGVSWTGTAPHHRDYVTIVPMGADEGEHGDYSRVGNADQATLEAPEETGLYEIRYVLNEGKRTLARHTVEVVEETAAIDDGGSLDVPETASPGETVKVNWSADDNGNDRRVALAGANQADFTWIAAEAAGDGPLEFTLPDEPGFYEFRLLDITDRAVLSRAMIEVQ